MTQIIVRTFLRAPIETVFDLARDISIHTQTAAHTREKIVDGKRVGLLELGDEITFEATHFFVRQRLSARIVALNRPHNFTDEMLRGAFQSLRHEHRFQSVGNDTQMTDILTWISPLGILGNVADALFLKRHMRRFLRHRNRILQRLAVSEKVKMRAEN